MPKRRAAQAITRVFDKGGELWGGKFKAQVSDFKVFESISQFKQDGEGGNDGKPHVRETQRAVLPLPTHRQNALENPPPRPKKHKWCTFVLEKENRDTLPVLREFEERLGLQPNSLRYCGIKDKFAITSQFISVQNVGVTKLISAAEEMHNVQIGNFSFHKKPLRLGQHTGNYFNVLLRDCNDIEQTSLLLDLEFFQGNGFVNYFGKQRFGDSNGLDNIGIGKAILEGRWVEAVERFCQPCDFDSLNLRYAKEAALAGRLEDAHEFLNKNSEKSRPAKILRIMKAMDEESCFKGLSEIPQNILRFYPLAYSSYRWNRKVREKLSTKPFLEFNVDRLKVHGSNKLRFARRADDDWFTYVEIVEGSDELSGQLQEKQRVKLERLIGKGFASTPRFVMVRPQDLKARKTKLVKPDPEPGKVHISLKFELPSGSYASTFLENVVGETIHDPDSNLSTS